MSDGTIKQVRVDNWGIFFLQRLQQLFSKSEQCDLVLHFSTNEKIKVHRLVLNACTEYFQMLEKQGFVIGDCLRMPHDLQADVVLPIINFMYTGRLEFRAELHKRLYTTAQQMNMTVLTKLLDAQNAATSPQVKPIIRRPPQVPITYNLQGKKIIPKQIDTDLPETLPGRKKILEVWEQTAEDFDEFISRNPGHFAFCAAPKLGFALLLYNLVFLFVKIPYSSLTRENYANYGA